MKNNNEEKEKNNLLELRYYSDLFNKCDNCNESPILYSVRGEQTPSGQQIKGLKIICKNCNQYFQKEGSEYDGCTSYFLSNVWNDRNKKYPITNVKITGV